MKYKLKSKFIGVAATLILAVGAGVGVGYGVFNLTGDPTETTKPVELGPVDQFVDVVVTMNASPFLFPDGTQIKTYNIPYGKSFNDVGITVPTPVPQYFTNTLSVEKWSTDPWNDAGFAWTPSTTITWPYTFRPHKAYTEQNPKETAIYQGIEYTIVSASGLYVTGYETGLVNAVITTTPLDGCTPYNIGEKAFENCTTLQTITINPNMSYIAAGAFKGCTNFTGDTSGNAIFTCGNLASQAKLEEAMFMGTKVNIGKELLSKFTSLGANCFNGCGYNGALTLPPAITSIGANCFEGNTFTGNLTIPKTVTSIGTAAFNGTGFSGKLYFEKGGTKALTISSDAFLKCNFKQQLDLGIGRLVTLGYNALRFNASYTTANESVFDISKITGAIPGSLFDKYKNTGTITIPETVTSVGGYSFRGGAFTGTVTVGSKVTSIGDYSLSGLVGATSLVFTNYSTSSLTTIGKGAFSASGYAGVVNLPNNLKTVGLYGFQSNKFTRVNLPRNLTLADVSDTYQSGNWASALSGMSATLKTIQAPSVFNSAAGITKLKAILGGTGYNAITSFLYY